MQPKAYYNQQRPHRAHDGKTPLFAFNARLNARPNPAQSPTHFRIRQDRVDRFGRITLRCLGRLRHIGLGLACMNRPVRFLVAGDHIRVVTEEGTLLRELTLDPQPGLPAPGRTYTRPRCRESLHDLGPGV